MNRRFYVEWHELAPEPEPAVVLFGLLVSPSQRVLFGAAPQAGRQSPLETKGSKIGTYQHNSSLRSVRFQTVVFCNFLLRVLEHDSCIGGLCRLVNTACKERARHCEYAQANGNQIHYHVPVPVSQFHSGF